MAAKTIPTTKTGTAAAQSILAAHPDFISHPLNAYRRMGIRVFQAAHKIDALSARFNKELVRGMLYVDHEGHFENTNPSLTVLVDSRLSNQELRKSLFILMALYVKNAERCTFDDVMLFDNYASKQPRPQDRQYVEDFLHVIFNR